MKRCHDVEPSWIRSRWRPAMAIVYMAIILFDFIVAPIFWSLIQYYGGGDIITQWAPLTLSSGGLFHAAMGAVLGVSAFTRGQEKIERIRGNLDKYNRNENFTDNTVPNENEFDM
jgi:hypothetical protein